MIGGWAYFDGVAASEVTNVEVSAVDLRSGERIWATCDRTESQEPNHLVAGSRVDLTGAAFEARLAVDDRVLRGGPWRIEVDVTRDGATIRRGFTSRANANTTAHLPVQVHARGRCSELEWSGMHGLRLVPAGASVVAKHLTAGSDGRLEMDLSFYGGLRPRSVAFVWTQGTVRARVSRARGGWRATWAASELAQIPAHEDAQAVAIERFGKRQPVRWAQSERGWVADGGTNPWAGTAAPDGSVTVRSTRAGLGVLRDVAVSADNTALDLDWAGGVGEALEVSLHGPRAFTTAQVAAGGRSGAVPLRYRPWSGRTLPIPEGDYSLVVGGGGEPARWLVGATEIERFPMELSAECGLLRCDIDANGSLRVEISAPLAERERGTFWQQKLRRTYGRQPKAKVERQTIYFDSWYGKSFSDNPAALFSSLSERFEHVWVGVQNPSIEVPAGATPVLISSTQWWEVLGRAGVIVTNTFLPGVFRKKPQQYLLQTWHGTPLKLLGLDRPERTEDERSAARIRRGTAQWSALISPNPYSSEIFRRAYAFDGELLETGYPRNDVLVNPGERPAQVRRMLGLSEDQRVVLYAPTWREDDKKSVGPLDCAKLQAALGDEYRVLLRGHSITLRRGSDLHQEGVLDVTSYPDMADLLCVADVLVTDYSSCMFDFSATGRPMVFYVPDIAKYVGQDRGSYFDLAKAAPGRVVQHERDVANAVLTSLGAASEVRDRYSSWREQFNVWDDGRASERVAQRI